MNRSVYYQHMSLVIFASLVAFISACGISDPYETKKTISVSDKNRRILLKEMSIWQPVDTANLDLLKGPVDSYSLGESIDCDFKKPEPDDFGSGLNPKFYCIDKKTGKELKVKYKLRNSEVYGEVAFSRLMYALGFYHDHYFSVRVTCHDCPKDPWAYIRSGGRPPNTNNTKTIRDFDFDFGTHVFLPAIIEEKMSGDKIEIFEDQGVSWKEFNDFSDLSLENKTIRDAFVLLMAFVHHADSKPDQQRLSCEKGQSVKIKKGRRECSKAKFLVHDGGWSFGAGVELSTNSMRAKMNREFWLKYPVFRNKKTCKIGVKKLINSEFVNKEISEDGRKFLADLLEKLSRKQIKDIFKASRVDLRDSVIHGITPEESLNLWADAFETRRREITETTCPKKLR